MADQRFQIGDRVLVVATVFSTYYTDSLDGPEFLNERRLARVQADPPFPAVVVGGCYRMVGTRKPGSAIRQGTWDEDYDPPSFKLKRKEFVWQVRRGLTNRILEVLPADCLPWAGDVNVPRVFCKDPGGWRGYREMLAKDAEQRLGGAK